MLLSAVKDEGQRRGSEKWSRVTDDEKSEALAREGNNTLL